MKPLKCGFLKLFMLFKNIFGCQKFSKLPTEGTQEAIYFTIMLKMVFLFLGVGIG